MEINEEEENGRRRGKWRKNGLWVKKYMGFRWLGRMQRSYDMYMPHWFKIIHVSKQIQLSVQFLTFITVHDLIASFTKCNDLTVSFFSWMTQLQVSSQLTDQNAI